MIHKRRVAVFTGNRAEYGLQLPIIRAIENHPNLDYVLLVSGAHLDGQFGRTLDEIKLDGFHIDAEIKIEIPDDSNISTPQAIASGIYEISRSLKLLKPDFIVVYADRFEGFAAVIAASQMNIPTAHIEGGDLTEGGALDDSVRHAMTKLSHLHFATNHQAAKRIIGMGEEAWRVHTVGFPAIDLINEKNYASEEQLANKLGLDLGRPIILFTQHSVTTEFDMAESQLAPSLTAIRNLAAQGVQCILTYPNNDAGGQSIIRLLDQLNKEKISGIQVIPSLGRYLYHGVLALAVDPRKRVVCVGNSSSGLKETPAFNCPAVNIGTRQAGRLRALNVLDVEYSSEKIQEAIEKCLYDESFRVVCRRIENPYGVGNAGLKIAEILASVEINQKLLRKRMTLIGEHRDGWHR